MDHIETHIRRCSEQHWWAAWAALGNDPEILARSAWDIMLDRAAFALGCDSAAATDHILAMLEESSMLLTESRSEGSSGTMVCTKLPACLQRVMPERAVAYFVGFRMVRSGRPFRVDWVVPVGRFGPITTIVADIELSYAEFAVVR